MGASSSPRASPALAAALALCAAATLYAPASAAAAAPPSSRPPTSVEGHTCAFRSPTARAGGAGDAFVVFDEAEAPADAVVFGGVFSFESFRASATTGGATLGDGMDLDQFRGWQYCVEQTNLCDGGIRVGDRRVPLVLVAKPAELWDVVTRDEGPPRFSEAVCETTDVQMYGKRGEKSTQLLRSAVDVWRDFGVFAETSVRQKVYEVKYDELIASGAVDVLVGDRLAVRHAPPSPVDR